MLVALTRAVSPSIGDCALTFAERQPIDVELAVRQHEAYEETLRRLGAQVVRLPPEPDLPDAVFVEDTAVVVDEVAVLTRPLLPVRQREMESVAAALAAYRPRRFIREPGTLEGGDVLRIGRTLYVGLTQRTNRAGIEQLAGFLAPYGYEVWPVEVRGCLHLKTACTYLGRDTVLAAPESVETSELDGVEIVNVPGGEPGAGNALLIGETIVLPASFPQTRMLLEQRGFRVEAVDVSELQKAEAGVTCCSILLENSEIR